MRQRNYSSRSRKLREKWRNLNDNLNQSFQRDKMEGLNRQLEELKTADEARNLTGTWRVIHDLSSKNRQPSA